MRRFVIGDIHGCAKALRTLIESIAPEPDDELIFLGDYVDRGPNSRDVVEQIIQLKQKCRVVTLRGNHEIMLLGVAFGGMDSKVWRKCGGLATVSSYGGSLEKIPPNHVAFFQGLHSYYETDHEIFVHAGYEFHLPMREQSDKTLYWNHLKHPLPAPHTSGKTVYVGHTPQPFGTVLNVGHLVCVDTYCFGSGFLTAYNLDTGDIIQTDRHGHLRRDPLADFVEQLQSIWAWVKSPFVRRKSQSIPSHREDSVNASADPIGKVKQDSQTIGAATGVSAEAES